MKGACGETPADIFFQKWTQKVAQKVGLIVSSNPNAFPREGPCRAMEGLDEMLPAEAIGDPGAATVGAEDAEGKAAAAAARPKRKRKTTKDYLNGLLGERGLPRLWRDIPRAVRLKGRGHERRDLGIIMRAYREWLFGWAPDLSFESGVRKMEAFGSTMRLKARLTEYRNMNMREWQKKLGIDLGEILDGSDAEAQEGNDPTPKKAGATTSGGAPPGTGDDIDAMAAAMLDDPKPAEGGDEDMINDEEMAFMMGEEAGQGGAGANDHARQMDEDMAMMDAMMGGEEEVGPNKEHAVGPPKPSAAAISEEQRRMIAEKRQKALEKARLRRLERERQRELENQS